MADFDAQIEDYRHEVLTTKLQREKRTMTLENNKQLSEEQQRLENDLELQKSQY